MGKVVVSVVSSIQEIDPIDGKVVALVLFHTRELAYQICHEFERFMTYLKNLKVDVFYGGISIKTHKEYVQMNLVANNIGVPKVDLNPMIYGILPMGWLSSFMNSQPFLWDENWASRYGERTKMKSIQDEFTT